MEIEETTTRGAWMVIPISGFNPNGCSPTEICLAIETGEHDLFEQDPEQDYCFVDAMGLDALPDKNELLADWYWEDRVDPDFRRDYELLQ